MDEELKRLRWGVAANAGRGSCLRRPRWAHVMDATGLGSSMAHRLCVEAGFSPDDVCGGADPCREDEAAEIAAAGGAA